MDRREVEDVEAQRGDLRQPRDAVVERAVLARHRALAARHHFVPGAVARPQPVGDERKQLRRVRSGRDWLSAMASVSSSAAAAPLAGLQVILALLR